MAEGNKNPDGPPVSVRQHQSMSSSEQQKQTINVNVTGAINSTVGTVCAVGVNYGEKSTKYRIRDFTEGMIRVSTVDKVLQTLNTGKRWITITGSAGDGKTTLAYLLLKEFVDKMNVYVIETPEDYHQISKTRENRIILLNDIFGAFDIDQSSIKNWTGVIEDIFDFQMKRSDFVTQVLFVSRKNVLQQAKVRLEHYGGNITEEEVMFDLSLVAERKERHQILDSHLDRKGIRVSDREKEAVAKIDTPHGFPHSCEMFADLVSKGHDTNIVEFFETPLKFLDKTTKLLFQTECTDLFITLVKNGGEFNPNSVSNDKERRTLRLVASHQEGSYLRKNEQGFWTFRHPSIYESVLSVVADEDPMFLVKHAKMTVIRQKVRFKKSGNDPTTCYILIDPKEPGVVDVLAERFIAILQKGDYDVFRYGLGTDKEFCERLITLYTKDEHGSTDLINKPGQYKQTLLSEAAFNCVAAKTLLKHGADPNRVDNLQRSLLDELCGLQCALHKEMIQLLINSGADVNLPDFQKKSPLHFLCESDDFSDEIFQLLVDSGADINAVDTIGRTPFFLFFKKESASVERVQLMINSGADVNIADWQGISPLHFLCQGDRFSDEMFHLLVDSGADVNAVDEIGWTPLFYLCENESTTVERLQLMIFCGADVTKLDRRDSTVLHILCRSKNRSEANLIVMLNLLIIFGADVNRRYWTGQKLCHVLLRNYPNYDEAFKLIKNA